MPSAGILHPFAQLGKLILWTHWSQATNSHCTLTWCVWTDCHMHAPVLEVYWTGNTSISVSTQLWSSSFWGTRGFIDWPMVCVHTVKSSAMPFSYQNLSQMRFYFHISKYLYTYIIYISMSSILSRYLDIIYLYLYLYLSIYIIYIYVIFIYI